MAYDPYLQNWVTVKCPVCCTSLGTKRKDEIKSFVCKTEGCSQTEHTFYPGQINRPKRSKPWAAYHTKNKCGKPCCEFRKEQ